jgi:hypothetical protein
MWSSVGIGVCASVGRRGTVPALAGRLKKEELSRCARGVGLIAFNARSGTVPLLLGRSVVFGDRLQGAGGVDVFCPPDVVRGPPR